MPQIHILETDMIYWETLTLKTWPSEPNLTIVLVVLPQPGFIPPACYITTTIDIIMCKVSSNKFPIDHMQGSNLQTAGSWAMTWRKHVNVLTVSSSFPNHISQHPKTQKKQLKRSLRNFDLGLRWEGHKKKNRVPTSVRSHKGAITRLILATSHNVSVEAPPLSNDSRRPLPASAASIMPKSCLWMSISRSVLECFWTPCERKGDPGRTDDNFSPKVSKCTLEEELSLLWVMMMWCCVLLLMYPQRKSFK